MWYCHPDTLMIAQAHSIASREGHPAGSAAALQAYRNAYARVAAGCWPESLASYLAQLDTEIANLREGRVATREASTALAGQQLLRPDSATYFNPLAFSTETTDELARRIVALMPSTDSQEDEWKQRAARMYCQLADALRKQRKPDIWERVGRAMGRW